jgi:D-3-phosphoglycerate dehydrogenase
MKSNKYFIIDFDSTFTQVEALDVLAEISSKDNNHDLKGKIQDITNQAMNGTISFRDALNARLNLLKANKSHLPALIEKLSKQVSKSFERNTSFLEKYHENIFIVSNGFKDFIDPIVTAYGIRSKNIFANEFIYDDQENIVGFNEDNILSKNNGKPELIRSLNLKGEVFVLGDGFTDYEIKKAGLAHKFYAFTENVRRTKVLEHADHEAPTLDDFLYAQKLERAHSYPKNRIKVLLLENIHPDAVERLEKEGYQVSVYPAGMTEDELAGAIKNVSILGIRSKTNVTRKVLQNANRLLAIGAYCIGTNQIDIEECLRKEIAVFNAPFSNTRSVVEFAIAEIILLMRNLPDKISAMHLGKWKKSASGSYEIRGKMLGIIGYGKIGSQLSVVAEAMGMNVQFYDLEEKLALGNARKCDSLSEILKTSDVISLHIDGRPENDDFIGHNEFELMKQGVVFLNLSRGKVVEVNALNQFIDSGKIKGIGVDVYPEEPLSNEHPFESVLKGKPNAILTPHVGGSTLEAQKNIAEFVPAKIIEYINTGATSNCVNIPQMTLPKLKEAHRFIHIHKNEPGVLAEINRLLALHEINIVGQYLSTNEIIGYVITDIDKNYTEEVIKDLKLLEGTIKFRVLY